MQNNSRNSASLSVQKQKSAVLLAIAATFTLLLLVFAILLTVSTVRAFRDDDQTTPDDDTPTDQTPGGDDPAQTPDDPNTPDDSTPTDSPFDTVTYTAEQVGRGNLILVNATHVYSFPTSNSHLVNIYNSQSAAKTLEAYYQLRSSQLLMDQTAYQAMNKMLMAFCEQSGLNNVLVADAYRDFDTQAALNSTTAAGYSDSHTGLSCALRVRSGRETVDLSSSQQYNWIYENCHKYGFVVRYPDGKEALTGVSDYNYYFRYVGAPHAYAMKANNWCLEEYIEQLRTNYTNTIVSAAPYHPLSVTTEDGSYEIYYVPATGEQTPVMVPKAQTYTVSGDNEGGFIVTVKCS